MNVGAIRRRGYGLVESGLLPSGYSQCEWIYGANATKSITTDVSPLSEWNIDVWYPNKPNTDFEVVLARYIRGSNYFAAWSNKNYSVGNNTNFGSCATRYQFNVKFTSYWSYAENLVTGASGGNPGQVDTSKGNIQLFGWGNQYLYKGYVYRVTCTSGGSFDGIPARRNSDSKYGLYDIANNVFYEWSGATGQLL